MINLISLPDGQDSIRTSLIAELALLQDNNDKRLLLSLLESKCKQYQMGVIDDSGLRDGYYAAFLEAKKMNPK